MPTPAPPLIQADHLVRRFKRETPARGFLGALTDLVRVSSVEREVVSDVSFQIAQGEAVALLGPNGAGKSTTIKMLCGILRPNSGSLTVGGLDPWRDRQRHVRNIGVVFGQRTQLWWDLAVIEGYDLLAAMFGVSARDYKARLDRFDAVLGIGALLRTPVRALSLGERMRCELAAALLHAPPILILDEPTIGLDVAVKLKLRAFLTELRNEGSTTLLLTTHDLGDVAALCPRVMVLAQGKLVHDGSMANLLGTLGGQRVLRVRLRTPAAPPPGAIADDGGFHIPFTGDAAELVRVILSTHDVEDLRVDDPSVEEWIARFYEGPA
ncbi:MAG: ATP-binding cassette domain-containing protein [Myxococcales bacterium]|nr:ATP-binding cassette domain-containing protein [Myxococcales bacterium]